MPGTTPKSADVQETRIMLNLLSSLERGGEQSQRRLVVLLLLSIALGLMAGSYLDPLLFRLRFSDSLVEEVRMRDIPFWFSFMALGALIGLAGRASLDGLRAQISSAALFAYIIYAGVRLFDLRILLITPWCVLVGKGAV